MGEEYLTLKQAAEVLYLHPMTLRRLYWRGELKAYLIGCSLRLRRSDLDKYITEHQWTPELCAVKTARPKLKST